VQLVISDSHRGLTNAVTTVLQGAAWQRCRVHFMRNALAKVNKGHAEMVAATIRTIFAQPTPDTVRGQVEVVADTLAGRFPAVADLLRDAKADLTAFADSPKRTGARSGPPTRSSASTGRSNAAPTSSGSSPTPTPCSGSRPAC
jgi:putative transposase